ncbi:uncharacterized protein LOC128953334 [Oppia nitens]|uniref:uncharacterized protein LOC128953334 n=1 Tax=Oppia nitens TaxID=1686743 RepID=UPI0023DCBDE5|nr:uncharacterized protein LOC128953334 [Oppia nitens]
MTEFIDNQLINTDNEPNNQLRDVGQWISRLIDYNYHRKIDIGGGYIYIFYNLLANDDGCGGGQQAPGDCGGRPPLLQNQLSDDQHIALGWINQLMIIYFLLIDDIVDQSTKRFGKTCWHLLPDVGMIALNDSTLILSLMFKMAKHYFKGHQNYMDIVECLHEIIEKVAIGQSMDLMNTKATNKHAQLDQFTYNCWSTINYYKIAWFSVLASFRLVLAAIGETDRQNRQVLEEIIQKFSRFIGSFNDYSDIYIETNGTDIAEGKCSWLYVRALQLATSEQRSILLDNYGLGSDNQLAVDRIEMVYNELNMKQEFCDYIDKLFTSIEDICRKQLQTSTNDRKIVAQLVLIQYNDLQQRYLKNSK